MVKQPAYIFDLKPAHLEGIEDAQRVEIEGKSVAVGQYFN